MSDKMELLSVSSEMKKFCQTTSVRGIPRIVNSKSHTQSVIWLIGVLTCACVLVWQLSLMFTRFCSYPVTTSFTQSPDWDKTTFPDVTVCNLCPLVHEKDLNLSYINYIYALLKEFPRSSVEFQKIYLLFKNNTDGMINTRGLLIDDLVSSTGYFRSYPITSNESSHGPVLACNYFNWDYTINYAINCTGNINVIWNPDFYKCYTFTLDDSFRKNIRGLSAIIYVDDYFDTLYSIYNLDLRLPRAKGMQVRVHSRGVTPDMRWGIPIGSGTSTVITLDQTIITNLPYPYSNCTTQNTLGHSDNVTKYMQSYCSDVCIQEYVLEQCGCISTTLRFTTSQLENSKFSICGNTHMNTYNSSIDWNGIKQLMCFNNLPDYRGDCNKQCPAACETYVYNPTISSAPWPHASAQMMFHQTFIKDSPTHPPGVYVAPHDITEKFDQFNELFTYRARVTKNATAAVLLLKDLAERDLFKDNFIQLNIQFNEDTYSMQTDAAAYSFDAFGAQIGGVLCLWLGVTIMFIFEVCELLINLMYAAYLVSKNPPNGKETEK